MVYLYKMKKLNLIIMSIKRAGAVIALVALSITSFMQVSLVNAQDSGVFSDITTSYDYYEAIDYLQNEGVVEGYGDGTYKPGNSINRAEFTKIALLASGYEPEGSTCFPDVTDQWFAPYVCKAQDLGLVDGYPDGMFKPERPINFVEAGKIVSNGLNLGLDETNQNEWFHKYIKALEEDSAIPLTIDTFDQYINRGEMAEMMWRIQTSQQEQTQNYEELKEMTIAQQMHTVSSCSVLMDTFEEVQSSNDYMYRDVVMMEAVDDATVTTSTDTKTAGAPAPAESEAAEEGDYSTTNVQVEGVDEADIVKTDGEYIYIVKGDTVRVVKAYLPENMVELDAIEFNDDDFSPTDMYVDGNKLVVLGHSYYSYPYPLDRTEAMIYPYPYYGGGISKVFIFDISDKADIKAFRSLEFEGSYSQSRKVDDMVYMVLSRPGFVPYDDIMEADEILPRYKDTGDEIAQPMVDCTDVKYVPAFESANYMIVAGIPINEASGDISKEVVLGSVGNVYSSRENMYIAANEWNWNYRSSSETTNVYKFSLGKEEIDFEGKGKVPGTILNQFSMDEDGDYFRIATTKGNTWDNTSTNNVYVLDEAMEMTGKLEGIAPGESIHSTRFMGDRLYMVTFKKIDPFFVIDMKDPKGPKILGKLKIPGYSDYLHPYDEHHIIGFGKDTVEATEMEEVDWNQDFAWYQGLKVAMFDVTDVTAPQQMFYEVIGDRGTDSELLRNHKALLFDKEKDLFAFPVTLAELSEEIKNDPTASGSEYGDIVFQGAYVYGIDLEDGFTLKTRITHYDETEVADKAGYYWYGDKDVERILYIGDFLYTVSKGMVMANDMLSEFAEVNSTEVGGTDDEYYYIME
ncbi:hypothetical protein GF369_02090 [Candidatus Peregrinibacteria bacterium]|nr:hypothetical protein [Candidatus Peregrinibacteria bacterium]